jgi:hypothetical protein
MIRPWGPGSYRDDDLRRRTVTFSWNSNGQKGFQAVGSGLKAGCDPSAPITFNPPQPLVLVEGRAACGQVAGQTRGGDGQGSDRETRRIEPADAEEHAFECTRRHGGEPESGQDPGGRDPQCPADDQLDVYGVTRCAGRAAVPEIGLRVALGASTAKVVRNRNPQRFVPNNFEAERQRLYGSGAHGQRAALRLTAS